MRQAMILFGLSRLTARQPKRPECCEANDEQLTAKEIRDTDGVLRVQRFATQTRCLTVPATWQESDSEIMQICHVEMPA